MFLSFTTSHTKSSGAGRVVVFLNTRCAQRLFVLSSLSKVSLKQTMNKRLKTVWLEFGKPGMSLFQSRLLLMARHLRANNHPCFLWFDEALGKVSSKTCRNLNDPEEVPRRCCFDFSRVCPEIRRRHLVSCIRLARARIATVCPEAVWEPRGPAPETCDEFRRRAESPDRADKEVPFRIFKRETGGRR